MTSNGAKMIEAGKSKKSSCSFSLRKSALPDACLIGLMSFAIFAGSSLAGANAAESSSKSESSSNAPNFSARNKLSELTLDDIQDTALLLDFIKEQCINIYEEASRLPVPLDAGPELKKIDKIPTALAQKNFLAPRAEWLVFFLGTIEPVVRQFGKFVDEVDSGLKEVKVPGQLESSLNPLLDQWANESKNLNHHLDELVATFDDAPNKSEKIRELAVACFNDTNHMEEIRRKVFEVIRKNKKSGGEKVLITPE